jgi:hypothetical protein
MKRCILGLAALSLFFCLGTVGWADANLVINGGFETGDFTAWTVAGDTRFDSITSIPEFVHSGDYAAQVAGQGRFTWLWQDIATTVGATYHVSYWLKADGLKPNVASVTFGEQMLFYEADVDAFPYTKYSFDVQATDTVSTLEFDFQDDLGYFHLDDVSVTAVPEPSALALLAAAAIGLLGYARRRRIA